MAAVGAHKRHDSLSGGRGDDEFVGRDEVAVCGVRPVVKHAMLHRPLALSIEQFQRPLEVEISPAGVSVGGGE